jgi:hypothetical protein
MGVADVKLGESPLLELSDDRIPGEQILDPPAAGGSLHTFECSSPEAHADQGNP